MMFQGDIDSLLRNCHGLALVNANHSCQIQNDKQYLLGDVHWFSTNDEDAVGQMLDGLSEVVDGGRGAAMMIFGDDVQSHLRMCFIIQARKYEDI